MLVLLHDSPTLYAAATKTLTKTSRGRSLIRSVFPMPGANKPQPPVNPRYSPEPCSPAGVSRSGRWYRALHRIPPGSPSTDRSLHQPSLLGASRLSVEPSIPAIRLWSVSSTSTTTFEVVEGLAKGFFLAFGEEVRQAGSRENPVDDRGRPCPTPA